MLLTLSIVIKTVCLFLLAVTTAFVLLYGKKNSGMKRDYLFTSIFFIVVLVVT